MFLAAQGFLIFSPHSSLLMMKPRKTKITAHWVLMLLATCAALGGEWHKQFYEFNVINLSISVSLIRSLLHHVNIIQQLFWESVFCVTWLRRTSVGVSLNTLEQNCFSKSDPYDIWLIMIFGMLNNEFVAVFIGLVSAHLRWSHSLQCMFA